MFLVERVVVTNVRTTVCRELTRVVVLAGKAVAGERTAHFGRCSVRWAPDRAVRMVVGNLQRVIASTNAHVIADTSIDMACFDCGIVAAGCETEVAAGIVGKRVTGRCLFRPLAVRVEYGCSRTWFFRAIRLNRSDLVSTIRRRLFRLIFPTYSRVLTWRRRLDAL